MRIILGVTQAVIPYMVEANITGISLGQNGGANPIDVPREVFRWRYEGTGQEVLATIHPCTYYHTSASTVKL